MEVDSLGLHAVTAMSTYSWQIPSGKSGNWESLLCHDRLLSKGKSATASSSLTGHRPADATDNRVET